MRRGLRILLNGATIHSALLCVATVGLWIRSDRVSDYVEWTAFMRRTLPAEMNEATFVYRRLEIAVGKGGVRAEWGSGYAEPADDVPTLSVEHGPPQEVASTGGAFWHRLGFERYETNNPSRGITAPLWAVSAVAAMLPCARLLALRRRRMKVQGICAACGYDCRATPDRCPECGAVAKA